jgi:hypothetical protein
MCLAYFVNIFHLIEKNFLKNYVLYHYKSDHAALVPS